MPDPGRRPGRGLPAAARHRGRGGRRADRSGDDPPVQLRPALTAYVKDLLGYGTPYEELPYAPAADVLAGAIAGSLTAGPGTDRDPAPQRWGEFLVAGLYVRHLLDLPPVRELVEAAGWVRRYRVNCVTSSPGPRPARTRARHAGLVRRWPRSLAFAEGSGMPEQIARQARPRSCPPCPPGLTQRRESGALDRLRFYLRCDVDMNGSPLYRLFREGMADQLRADAGEDTAEATDTAPPPKFGRTCTRWSPQARDRSRQSQHASPTCGGTLPGTPPQPANLRPAPRQWVPRPRPPRCFWPRCLPACPQAPVTAPPTPTRLLRHPPTSGPTPPEPGHRHRRGPLRARRPSPRTYPRGFLAACMGGRPEQVSRASPDMTSRIAPVLAVAQEPRRPRRDHLRP